MCLASEYTAGKIYNNVKPKGQERDWSEGELSVLKPRTRYLTNNINILPSSIVACFAGLHSLNN